MNAPSAVAVLPYWELAPLDLGFASVSPFALLAWLGAVCGVLIAVLAGRARGLAARTTLPAALTGLLGGLAGGHVAALLLYRPELLRHDALARLRDLAGGGSSLGGLLTGALAATLWCVLARRRVAPHLDALAVGAALGFALGRIGCALVHDHPGLRSTVFLAVDYPGGPRLDLGLLEALALAVLALGLGLAAARPGRAGALAASFAGIYGALRLGLDGLRIDAAGAGELARAGVAAVADPRLGGLTPGQWMAALLVLAALRWRWAARRPPARRSQSEKAKAHAS